MKHESLEFEFKVLDPERDMASVSSPQILVYRPKTGGVLVLVYFMENTALKIETGVVKSAMGKITLQYDASHPSGAHTASVSLRKLSYFFPEPDGMTSNFIFTGRKL